MPQNSWLSDLKEGGELVKIEDYAHNVGHCYRCNTVVEPMRVHAVVRQYEAACASCYKSG